MITLRTKRILWIIWAFVTFNTTYIFFYVVSLESEVPSWRILVVAVMICFPFMFLSLLFIEKSLLRNGMVAFMFWAPALIWKWISNGEFILEPQGFWLPLKGWFWILTEEKTGTLPDAFFWFKVGMFHAFIQIYGKLKVNKYILIEKLRYKQEE
jgi:hypothetical protein